MNAVRRLSFFCTLAFASGLSSPQLARACRCVEPSPARAYALADVVIIGSVESVEMRGDLSIATFSVDEGWKQDTAGRIEIAFGGPCAFPFERSGSYLIYATRGRDGSFATRRCRGDVRSTAAGEKIAWLRRHGKASVVRK